MPKLSRLQLVLGVTLASAAAGAISTAFDLRPVATRAPFLALDEALLRHRVFLLISLAGWALFSLYWEAAARRVLAAQTSESRASRRVHVFLANAALLLEILPIRGFGRYLPAAVLVMSAGLAVEAAGSAIAIWARRHLGRYWSGEISIKVEHQLIRSGTYRLLHHPIYTGILAMYAGVALVTGEWLAILGFAMAAFAYWRKMRLEEANLRVAFGLAYDAYCDETWALVPGLF